MFIQTQQVFWIVSNTEWSLNWILKASFWDLCLPILERPHASRVLVSFFFPFVAACNINYMLINKKTQLSCLKEVYCVFVKDWFRELNSTGPHMLAGAVINFAIASTVKSFIYKLAYLLFCQKIVRRMYFWCICLNVRNDCQFTVFKQFVVISNISLQRELLGTGRNKQKLCFAINRRQTCLGKLIVKEPSLYAKYCGENTNCEGLFNWEWWTEGAGQIVAFNSQHCPWGLRNLGSLRTDYNPFDVVLPSQRFLKYRNSAVKQQQKPPKSAHRSVFCGF